MKRLLFLATTLLMAMTARAADELVTLPAGVEAEEYTLKITHRIYQGENETTLNNKEMTTLVAFDGNDVYVSGLAYYFPKAYVKGTLSGDKVTFESGQFVGADQYGSEYLTSFVIEEGKGVITPFVLIYDSETRALTFDASINLSETTAKNGGGFYADIVSAEFTEGGLPPLVPVSVPEGLSTELYLLSGKTIYNDKDDEGNTILVEERCERPVNIGFDGDNLYIQGLVEQIPEGWVMATKNSQGKYVVPAGQYVGTLISFNLTFDYFVTCLNRSNKMVDVVFTYNETDGSFSCSQTIAMTSSATVADCYYWISNATMKKVIEKEATPATPEFTFSKELSPYGGKPWYYADFFVPASDVNGEPMVTDKLSFVFFAKKGEEVKALTFEKSKYYMLEEDITEIPYGFTDRLDIGLHTIYFEKMGEDELKSWTALGLQSIYRGMGIEHKSEIFWYDMTKFWESQGIATVIDSDNMKVVESYDLQGRKTDASSKGLVIRRVVKADGTTTTVKCLNK